MDFPHEHSSFLTTTPHQRITEYCFSIKGFHFRFIELVAGVHFVTDSFTFIYRANQGIGLLPCGGAVLSCVDKKVPKEATGGRR